MPEYTYAPDGKIHTRYSELKRATPGSIRKLMEERLEVRRPFKNDALGFGETRHEMFRDESLKTMMVPECFGYPKPLEYVEEEFTTELFPGVIVHSRPDAVSVTEAQVIDYKTMTYKPTIPTYKHALKAYQNDLQCVFYAMQLGIHGVAVTQRAYLIEIWNRERSTVIAYDRLILPITLAEQHKIKVWAKERCELLIWAHEELAPEIKKSLDNVNTSALVYGYKGDS